MYAVYQYKAGSTAANILADVIKILTGTTLVSSLSTNCVVSGSSITTTASAAGWGLYSSTGTSGSSSTSAVLSAACLDNPTQSVYMDLNVATAGYLIVNGFETWSIVGVSGTNETFTSSTVGNCQRTLIASGGYLYIHANQGHAFFHSLQGGVYGSSNGTAPCGIFQRTRRSAWDTTAAGYPPFFWVNFDSLEGSTVYAYAPRYVNNLAADVTGVNAPLYGFTHLGYSAIGQLLTTQTTTLPLDSSKDLLHPFWPLAWANYVLGMMGGDITGYSDVWLTTYAYGSFGDTTTYNSNTYVIWTSGTNRRIALRLG